MSKRTASSGRKSDYASSPLTTRPAPPRGRASLAEVERMEREGWITRREARRRTGVSQTTITRYEREGLIKTHHHGDHIYLEASSVDALAADRKQRGGVQRGGDGEVAARVFSAFDRGLTLSEIVINEKVAPVRVRALYAEYQLDLETGEIRRAARQRELDQIAAENREAIRTSRDVKQTREALSILPSMAPPDRRRPAPPAFLRDEEASPGARIPKDPIDAPAPEGPVNRDEDEDEGEGD